MEIINDRKPTEAQKEAIKIIDQNLQMIACAGSGKTYTIVQRIINILKRPDVLPQNIVAITFTDKAGNELRERIYRECEKQLGTIEGLAEMYIGTIHGFCYEIIQQFEFKYLKYTVLNEMQTRLFVDKTYNENGMKDLEYKGKPFNRYIDSSLFIDIMNTVREANLNSKIVDNKLQSVLLKYQSTLDSPKYRYFDYASILIKAIESIENNKKVKKYLSETLKFLIIDEYQDVNPIQEKLINLIYQHGANLCVVGDDDQTIYHWRGSNTENIINFPNRYNHVVQEKLLKNFRSSEGITDAAKTVIRHNVNRLDKLMISAKMQNYEENDIIGKIFESEQEEIDFVINKIKQVIGIKFTNKEGTRAIEYRDIAILVYSVKNIPPYLLERLQRENIDFIVEGTKNLFETKEIQAAVAIFDYLVSKCTLDLLKDAWNKVDNGFNQKDIDRAIKNLLIPKTCTDWEDFNLQNIFRKFLVDIDIYNIVSKDIEKVLYNFAKFSEVINDFETVHLKTSPEVRAEMFSNFLKYNASSYYPEGWLAPNYKAPKSLRIMTFFQAKGLEFPVVFMPFLTQNFMFPPKHGGKSKWEVIKGILDKNSYESDDEDLRRLFYVGITRSEKFLFMSHSPHFLKGNSDRAYRKIAEPFAKVLHSEYVSQNNNYDFADREKYEGGIIDEQQNISLDFTTLRDFFECPNKFRYSYIYGFHDPLDVRMGYGKSIHNILTEIHNNYKEIGKITNQKIEQLLNRHFFLPYAPPKLTKDMRETARKDIVQYLKDNEESFNEITYVEKKIEFSLENGVFINGRIDLVKNEKTGKTKIVDFKSKKVAQSKELEQDQLMMYALGYRYLTGEDADLIEAYHIDTHIPHRFTIDKNNLKIMEEKIKDVADSIKNNTYNKKICEPGGIELCRKIDCRYIDSCLNNK